MSLYCVLSPAYGRDYRNGKLAREAFNSNVDWVVNSVTPDNGRYVSKSSLPPGTKCELRFNNCRGLTVVTV